MDEQRVREISNEEQMKKSVEEAVRNERHSWNEVSEVTWAEADQHDLTW